MNGEERRHVQDYAENIYRRETYWALIKELERGVIEYQAEYPAPRRRGPPTVLSGDLFGRVLAEVGDWSKIPSGETGKAKGSFRSRAVWRNARTPWDATFPAATRASLLQSIARTYCFLAPTAASVTAAAKICTLNGDEFAPGELVFAVVEPESGSPSYIGVRVIDLLVGTNDPFAIMEYARFGVVSDLLLDHLTGRQHGSSLIRDPFETSGPFDTIERVVVGLESELKVSLELVGVTPSVVSTEHADRGVGHGAEANWRQVYGTSRELVRRVGQILNHRVRTFDVERKLARQRKEVWARTTEAICARSRPIPGLGSTPEDLFALDIRHELRQADEDIGNQIRDALRGLSKIDFEAGESWVSEFPTRMTATPGDVTKFSSRPHGAERMRPDISPIQMSTQLGAFNSRETPSLALGMPYSANVRQRVSEILESGIELDRVDLLLSDGHVL